MIGDRVPALQHKLGRSEGLSLRGVSTNQALVELRFVTFP